MAELDTGVDVFVRDCVYFQHPKLGLSKGVIVKFFQVVCVFATTPEL